MITLALTGFMGAGKTSVAQIFERYNIPVYNADETVHALYKEKKTIDLIAQQLPELYAKTHVINSLPKAQKENIQEKTKISIDRQKLSAYLLKNPHTLKALEAIIHPLVQKKEQDFLEAQKKAGAKLVLLEIPLLFEIGKHKKMDKILLITAPPELRKKRVMARGNMSEEKYNFLAARQIDEKNKMRQADFILDTNCSLEETEQEVEAILRQLKAIS